MSHDESTHGYTLPATAVCPGCGRLVVLPAEPLFPDTPPTICATCDTEIPDYRREAYSRPPTRPCPTTRSRRRRSRTVATAAGTSSARSAASSRSAAIIAVESAKDRFNQ